MNDYYYGADEWVACAVCGTKRPPKCLKETLGKEGVVCNDDWCERARKLDDLLAAAEARKRAGLENPQENDPSN